jgi:hypothetical protein
MFKQCDPTEGILGCLALKVDWPSHYLRWQRWATWIDVVQIFASTNSLATIQFLHFSCNYNWRSVWRISSRHFFRHRFPGVDSLTAPNRLPVWSSMSLAIRRLCLLFLWNSDIRGLIESIQHNAAHLLLGKLYASKIF